MDEKEFDYMNVIPLVDVMLVLLTIVLTTSTFIASGLIPVELPKAEKSQKNSSQNDKQKLIEIDKEGQIFYSGKPVALSELSKSMEPLDRDIPVVIRADRSIYLELFVQVLGSVKKAGFHNVSLQTEEKG
jgi:biopolymer transport protein ExbD